MAQMALPLQLADHAVFASFLASGNEPLVATLKDLADGNGAGCCVWGAHATGKTHLLQAMCDAPVIARCTCPSHMLFEAGPAVIDGLAQRASWCASMTSMPSPGTPPGSRHYFTCCTPILRARWTTARRRRWRLARVPCSSQTLKAECHDCRYSSCTPLTSSSAHRRSSCAQDTAVWSCRTRLRHYLLERSRRDMASLYELLDRLDLAALQAQRKLTVPFVSDVLRKAGWTRVPSLMAVSGDAHPALAAISISSADNASGGHGFQLTGRGRRGCRPPLFAR